MADNPKKVIRDAAIALLQAQTSAVTVRAFTDRLLNPDELPAILVSTAAERAEAPARMGSRSLLISLTLRFVGMSSLQSNATQNVIDVLDALEAEATAALDIGAGSANDPLGIGAVSVYFDNSEEPVLDDEHQELVAVIETTYGVALRVATDDLSEIVA